HPEGFFVASLAGEISAYRLRAASEDGGETEFDDPYRFPPLISDFDLHLHSEGTLYEAYESMGAHVVEVQGVRGVRFAVWAPNAENVTVAGDFNDWDSRRHPMRRRSGGVWELFLPGLGEGAIYKYNVRSRYYGHRQLKADPYGFQCETPPKSASIVVDLNQYEWRDDAWLKRRAETNWLKAA